MNAKSLIPKNYKKVTPDLSIDSATREILDKKSLLAEIEMIDTVETFSGIVGRHPSFDRYVYLAEIYAIEYDNHYLDINKILAAEGVIVEMYSDIFKHEDKHGESEKSKAAKERIMILRNGLEDLKKYHTKYDQLKDLLLNSVRERNKLAKENAELKKQLKNMVDAENY
jgi:hypothetical protein